MDREIYSFVGVPEPIIQLLLWGVAAEYDCKARTGGDDYRCRVSTPVQNATGTTMTSSGNTVHVACVPIYAMIQCVSIEDAARALGMRFKVKYLGHLMEATFLKCVVAPVSGPHAPVGVFFALSPQLGLVGKLCKTMTHPSYSLGVPDRRIALAMAADMICRSILVPPDYPILGAFLAAHRRVATAVIPPLVLPVAIRSTRARGVIENNEFRFFSDARDVRRADVLPILCSRYDITEVDILEVEALFDGVRSLPWFVSHPAIVRIMEVDYS
jgi:hypothetical protein